MRLRHRGLHPGDTFLAAYPKSGNTWLKFMVAELAGGEEVDFESTESMVPAIGRHHEAPQLLPGGGRIVKTHEPFRGDYGRAVYLVRDVRDVIVSYHHYVQWRSDRQIDLDAFLDGWVSGRLDGLGPWHEHVTSWLDARQSGVPVFLVRYEDLRAEPREWLGKVAEFLRLDPGDGALESAVAHNQIERMREKEILNREFFLREWKAGQEPGFVRKGAVGDWRTTLSPRHLKTMGAATEVLAELGYPSA